MYLKFEDVCQLKVGDVYYEHVGCVKIKMTVTCAPIKKRNRWGEWVEWCANNKPGHGSLRCFMRDDPSCATMLSRGPE